MGKAGRPSEYTEEIGQQIANLIASDYTYEKIEAIEGMPNANTITRWFMRHDDFADKCTRARLQQAHTLANKMSGVIERVESGKMAPDAGRVVLGGMQWLAARKNSRVYGDRQILAGDVENPVTVLASRLDQAIVRQQDYRKMIDITPVPEIGSDLV